jgi:hypothetical protein
MDFFVFVDPSAHNPTWFSSSVEFKESEVEKTAETRWHGWERDRMAKGRRRAGPDSLLTEESRTTEAVIGVAPEHFLNFALFERLATGMDAGERLLFSDKVEAAIHIPGRLRELLEWPGTEQHPLLSQLGLTLDELMDALQSRFRLMAAVRGGVAEVHLARLLSSISAIAEVQHVDADGRPDFEIRYKGRPFRIECKNVLRKVHNGVPRVDFQKTRASKGDACSRYYDPLQFEVLAACLHPVRERWEFAFCATRQMAPHPKCPGKLSDRVLVAGPSWYESLPTLLEQL